METQTRLCRGSRIWNLYRGRLKDSNQIVLPEYWDGLVDPSTITVTLTQIGYSQDLIVDSIDWGKIVKVRSGVGANINCYYEVWAARYINPMNHDEKLHVVYDGDSPKDYPGNNEGTLSVDGIMIVVKPSGYVRTMDK